MVDDGEYTDAEFEEWSRIVLDDESRKEWEIIENASWEEGDLSDQEDGRYVLCEDEPSGDDWEIQDEEGGGRGDLDP